MRPFCGDQLAGYLNCSHPWILSQPTNGSDGLLIYLGSTFPPLVFDDLQHSGGFLLLQYNLQLRGYVIMPSLHTAYKRLILHSAPATKMRQELVEDIKFTNISKLKNVLWRNYLSVVHIKISQCSSFGCITTILQTWIFF